MLDDVRKSMMKEFDISDLGPMHCFIGIKVIQLADDIFLSVKTNMF